VRRLLKDLAIATLVVVSAGTATCAGWLWYSGGCRNTIQQRIPSPDGQKAAVVFERDCGATTDYGTHVAVLARDAPPPRRSGNAYVYGHRTKLTLRWDSPSRLQIRHFPGHVSVLEPAIVDGVGVYHTDGVHTREP
jgi:hypothetical protein